MVEDFRACCQYAEKTGVVLGMQHHNNFLFQSDEIIDILERVDSKWFGLNLDTGSLHAEDPYLEIENLAPYARYWFIKEFVYPGGTKTSVDMKRIAGIIKENGYRGYVSFENLSPEDPKKTVAGLFETFRNEYEKV